MSFSKIPVEIIELSLNSQIETLWPSVFVMTTVSALNILVQTTVPKFTPPFKLMSDGILIFFDKILVASQVFFFKIQWDEI